MLLFCMVADCNLHITVLPNDRGPINGLPMDYLSFLFNTMSVENLYQCASIAVMCFMLVYSHSSVTSKTFIGCVLYTGS